MLTKAIKYVDYNGNEKTKNFYFNLTKSEITEMELSERAGLEGLIKQIINTDDRKGIIDLFKRIVLSAVGEKSADGERFEKSDEIRAAFEQHPAWDILFMDLIANEKSMADFINAIIPQEIASEAQKQPRRSVDEIMGYDNALGGNAEKPNLELVKPEE